ncbi:hypothetical protein [Rhodovibrio salinarum]|uniref:Tetratricopeptide repeat-containing protein n=1 Tax=Rhodovibrio salinarum TaxID=1087 RepID=A0A934V172_9PROT|nr:hypothetical protein [Rhodovibrio salinarum]MBK1698503.1 hypothetical protein [Rhodovibrio salinarum]
MRLLTPTLLLSLMASSVLALCDAHAQDGGQLEIVPPASIDAREFRSQRRSGEITASDLAALRYYKQSGQDAKFQAEVERLQRIKPGWTPPENLGAEPSGPNVQPLWDLYGEGAYAAVRARIAELRQANPDWQPPADMMQALERARQRQRLVSASDIGAQDTVIQIAEANPGLLTCESIDLIWRTAEAYAATDQPERARTRFASALRDCAAPEARVATLEKAHAALPPEATRTLLSVARNVAQRPETERAIARIEGYLDQSRLAAAADGQVNLSSAELARYGDQAKQANDPETASTLGWYHQKRKQHRQAQTWFERSQAWGGGSASGLGLVLALRDQGKTEQAEETARAHAGNRQIRDLLVGIATDRLANDGTVGPEHLKRYASLATRYENATLAMALGWEHYNSQRFDQSADWFARALTWAPSAKAAEGRVLALSQAGRLEAARETLNEWRDQYPEIADTLEVGDPASPLMQAMQREDYGACLAEAQGIEGTADYGAAEAVAYGWCLVGLNRHVEAEIRFEQALSLLDEKQQAGTDWVRLRRDALLGQATSLITLGQVQRAMQALQDADLPQEQTDRLKAQALAKYAYIAMERQRYAEVLRILEIRRRYAAPTRGLKVIQGWANYNLGNNGRAAQIFSDLNIQFSTEDTRHALAVVRKYTR